MFLNCSEKNHVRGIDESYDRCYSFTKIKKDVEVFRKCADNFLMRIASIAQKNYAKKEILFFHNLQALLSF